MKVGIISDTHGFLDPRVFEAFEGCDEIWHAGDFGSVEVAEELEAFVPLRGVFGNIDGREIRTKFPRDLRFDCDGVDVWITHIAGRPGRYDSRVRQQLADDPPDVLICGHSHIVSVENDDRYQVKYMNPGAAGHQGFHVMRTLLKAEFVAGSIRNMSLVELGPRGRPAR